MYLFLLLHFYCREGGCFLKKLLVYIRDFRLECVLAPLFKLLEASFELIVPLIMAAIIDRGIPSGDTGFIVRMCLWLVVLGGVGLLSSVTAQYFSAKAAIGFSAKLRHVLHGAYPDAELHRAGYRRHLHAHHPHEQRHQSGADRREHDACACCCVRPSSSSARWSWRSPSTRNAR